MAIAFDTSASVNSASNLGANTATLASYTVATGGILIVMVQWNSNATAALGDITGVTYNGVAMTRAVGLAATAWASSIWYLLNPTTGSAQSIVATSGNANVNVVSICAQSYTGASVAAQPDSSGSASQLTTATPFNVPITVGGANCWLVSGYCAADDAAPTGNNLTRRQLPVQQFASGDTNGTIGTGAQNAIWNSTTGGGQIVGTVIALQPPAAFVASSQQKIVQAVRRASSW